MCSACRGGGPRPSSWCDRSPAPDPCRNRDHGSVSSPPSVEAPAAPTSTSPSARTAGPSRSRSRSDNRPMRDPLLAALQRPPPAQSRRPRQAVSRDTPCATQTNYATQTKADWKYRADPPSPIPTGQRKGSPRRCKAFRRRPSTAATRVNNFKATDRATVSKLIPTVSYISRTSARRPTPGWYRSVGRRKLGFRSSHRPPGFAVISDQAGLAELQRNASGYSQSAAVTTNPPSDFEFPSL
jgi:hypothetical protein